MTLTQVKNHFGSPAQVMRVLRISRQSWTTWINQGHVPLPKQHVLEMLTAGALKANLKHTNYAKGKKNDR